MRRTVTSMGESYTYDSSNKAEAEAAEMAGFGKYLYQQNQPPVFTSPMPASPVVFPGGNGYSTSASGYPGGYQPISRTIEYGNGTTYTQQMVPQQQPVYGNPYYGGYYQQPVPQQPPMMMQQPPMMIPMMGGGGQQPPQPPRGANPIFQQPQPPYGLGASPYYTYNNGLGQNYCANPAAAANPFIQQDMYSCYSTAITIPPVRHGGETLFDKDAIDRIDTLRLKLVCEDMKRTKEDRVNNTGYFYGSYYDNSRQRMIDIVNKAIEEEVEKARGYRKEFEMNLSRIAHKHANDGVTEEQIQEAYTGKTIQNPLIRNREDIEFEMKQARFRNMVPIDTSLKYKMYDAAVTAEFRSVIPKNTTLKELGPKLVELQNKYDLDEEYHRRLRYNTYRTGKATDSYRYFMQRRIELERAEQNGVAPDLSNIKTYSFMDGLSKNIISNDGKVNTDELMRTIEKSIVPEDSVLTAHINDSGDIELGGDFNKFMQMKASGQISQEELDALDNPVLDPSDYEEFMNPPASINKYTTEGNNERKYNEDRDNFIRFANSVYVEDYDPRIHDTHSMKGSVSEYDLSPPNKPKPGGNKPSKGGG